MYLPKKSSPMLSLFVVALVGDLNRINYQGSRRTVLALGNMGLDVWIVTGDNRRVAAALARRLGVAPDRVLSEVLPAEKARKVCVGSRPRRDDASS